MTVIPCSKARFAENQLLFRCLFVDVFKLRVAASIVMKGCPYDEFGTFVATAESVINLYRLVVLTSSIVIIVVIDINFCG